MDDYRQKAEYFLKHETQFHLGVLPTEQSHPKTRGLAETLQRDVAAGIRLLQSVDPEVADAARRVFRSAEYAALVTAMNDAFRNGGRVCFSGCGATGRLSILLESCWRHFWTTVGDRQPGLAGLCASQSERVCSIMTGGDYALIRSVENFEDYATFGRRQVVEAGLGRGDVLVAISEGGETSSVIGTILEAEARGVRPFFVFNNPADVLARHIERSRQVIEDPAVTVLDLTSGPMAVAGSTRMQATTAELLVVGTALDHALAALLPAVLPPAVLATLPATWLEPQDGVRRFGDLLADLSQPAAVDAMAAWVEVERALYAGHGRMTYFAAECLLDIFTDTTERSPTFMMPPFRKCDDVTSPPSWAFVKDPLRTTPAAWQRVLCRAPRCLEWDRSLYEAMAGPANVRANPPRLGHDEILKFRIGNEDDPSRYEAPDSVAMAVLLSPEAQAADFAEWLRACAAAAQPFRRRLAGVIGPQAPSLAPVAAVLHVPCRLVSTPLGLWHRLAAKLVLNSVSTATMGCLGRLTSNWMANVEPTNKKLVDRGTRLVSELAGVDYPTACYALHQTIEELRATAVPGRERPSPVAVTIARLRQAGAEPERTGTGTAEFLLRDATGTSARFSPRGELLELIGKDSGWTFAVPGYGWSLQVLGGGQATEGLWPCSLRTVAPAGPASLQVLCDRLRYDDGREVEATVELVWQLVDGLLQGRLVRVQLPEGLKPAALNFPDVRVPYAEAVQWIVPEDLGRVLENPGAEHVTAKGMPCCIRRRAHMQFMAWTAAGAGLYLDSRDTAGWTKSLVLRVGEGLARLSLEHSLPQPPSGAPEFPAYSVSLAAFKGGWYEAARLYRPWALAQAWAARGPAERRGSYVAEAACWLWNRGRIDNVVPATTEVARRLGLPVALDWYWWHKKPYDSGYPDYFPPREGEERFRAAVRDLQRHHIAVQVYTNGVCWDQDEPDWPTTGRLGTVKLQNGEYQGHVFNTWMNRRLMYMCGASDIWHQRALQTADKAAALGLDGLYMDMIAITGGMTPCYSPDHGHTPGGGAYGTQGFRELFSRIRARHPHLRLSSESVAEVYQDLLDACITLQTSSERGGRVVPLFQAVYHGHAVVFGMYTHIDGITPYDEAWPPEQRPAPASEKDWHALCPDQFALAVARTVAYGCQPTATNLTVRHLTAPEFAADVAFFLDACRFYHAHREWLLWGEMLAPGELRCGMVEVSCIDRNIFTRPEALKPFTVHRPAVLHSAWRSPAGAAGLVLVNYTRQAQTVTVERPDGLLPAADGAAVTLAPRSLQFVPLAPARQEPCPPGPDRSGCPRPGAPEARQDGERRC